jgi:hypothetical protein
MANTASADRANLFFNRVRSCCEQWEKDGCSNGFMKQRLHALGESSGPKPNGSRDRGDMEFQKEDLVSIARITAVLEHIRWNTYMRSEGFRPITETRTHDKKHKVHENIVGVSKLTVDDCLKDI